ncbi:MAG: hypothetical protein HYX47_14130 [Burkholderiales bacterium]|nr:hypothetical protein [Burkholderiales bacterium]
MGASGFTQGIVAFGAYVLLVLAALRLAPRVEPALVAVAAAFVACIAALPALSVLAPGFNFWVYLVSYWFLATCFLMAFGAVYKSLSLRILADLLARPGRSDDYQDIFSRYLVEDSYQNRLSVIRDKGLVTVTGGSYELAEPGRRLARRVQKVQLWFGITRSG